MPQLADARHCMVGVVLLAAAASAVAEDLNLPHPGCRCPKSTALESEVMRTAVADEKS